MFNENPFMDIKIKQFQAKCNNARFNPNLTNGFYESFFIRANHPLKKQAFWIRYTVFASGSDPDNRFAELWFAFFDEDRKYMGKEYFDLFDCSFPRKYFDIHLGANILNSVHSSGICLGHSWDLNFQCKEEPLFFLPLNLYYGGFPKAKSIVSQPQAVFNGVVNVAEGHKFEIKDWKGSQNHNWGTAHTDHYAWGQVAAFDNAPSTFMELISAKLKIGPFNSPFITIMVLRHNGIEHRFNTPDKWLMNKGAFTYFEWSFSCENAQIKVEGTIKASKEDFVGFNYFNPSGGTKDCLNSKLASCSIKISHKDNNVVAEYLYSKHACAFEILTNESIEEHGIEINFKDAKN